MHDHNIPRLAASIDRDRILRARAMDPLKKVSEGLALHDDCLTHMRDGIRAQYPQFTPEQQHAELQRRMLISRMLDDQSLFQQVESNH